MSKRLTQEQLNQIIAETQRIQTLREKEIEPEQVKQILEELNLPVELLDEAIMQVERRKVLEIQKRRNKLIIGAIAASLTLVIGSGIFISQQRNAILAGVTAQSDRIITNRNLEGAVTVSRQNNSELTYRVTLQNAPVGQQLDLSCNWIDPSGQIVKQNSYQTRNITTSIWNTQCRYSIDPGAAIGKWKVEMLLGSRVLSDEVFEVQ
ncbi:MAG: DUF3859 domain-containing protein [Calothrix sp. C42_A2020_038]|nr:DUF3859 domain-containing protein [Calothrix sp. C42_A2020_038]